VRPDTPEESFYLPACRTAEIYGDANSRKKERFRFGLTFTPFEHAFARCLTGARIRPERIDWTAIETGSTEQDRILIRVLQDGSFGERTA
jgi:hypothetical protein